MTFISNKSNIHIATLTVSPQPCEHVLKHVLRRGLSRAAENVAVDSDSSQMLHFHLLMKVQLYFHLKVRIAQRVDTVIWKTIRLRDLTSSQ